MVTVTELNRGFDFDGEDVTNVGAFDADSVSTPDLRSSINNGEYQTAIDGLVVPIGPGFGVSDAVDPSTTTTPVQDATDKLASAGVGGTVLISGSVTSESTYTWKNGISVLGTGRGNLAVTPDDRDAAVWNFADGVAPMMEFGNAANVGDLALRDISVSGAGDDSTATTVMSFIESGIPTFVVENVEFRDFYGQFLDSTDPDGGPFQSAFRDVVFDAFDAGDEPALIQLQGLTRCNFEDVSAYPTAATSGSLTQIFETNNSMVLIDGLNMGGTVGRIISQNGDHGFDLRGWNWEPNHSLGDAPSLMLVRENTTVGRGKVNTTFIDPNAAPYVYSIRDAGNTTLHKPNWGGNASSNFDGVGIVANSTVAPVWYFGEGSGDWNKNSQTADVRLMSGAGTVL